jgi:hypothetical protein
MTVVDTGELDIAPKKRRYDRDAAFDAYCRWLDGDERALDETLRYAKRFCIMWVNKLYKTNTLETREEVLHVCLMGIWWAVRKKRIARNVRSLHGYMRATVINARGHAARTFWGRDLQKIGSREEYVRKYYARMPDDRTMEAEIFITELPAALRKRALRHSRHTDPKIRGGIQYIINRLTRRERIVPTWLYDEYGIERERARYFTEHAIVLIRMVMYDMRTHEVSFRSDEEKRRILDQGFEPCIVAR